MNTQRLQTVHSDIRSDLLQHPGTEDLLLQSNEAAIISSIKNLLLTDRMERPFQPRIGSSIRAMLFENFTPRTESRIKLAVEETIENFEPRCNLIDVIVEGDPDNNEFNVRIEFSVSNRPDPVQFDVILKRQN